MDPSNFPASDSEFQDTIIKSFTGDQERGFQLTRSDGWSIHTGLNCPVVPEVGQHWRLYGKGIGYPVRGMFIDGQKVYYRTVEEQKAHSNETAYGKDAAEWLRRWDEGRSVWSISMGGLGPGYEQAIQITAAELLRRLIEIKVDMGMPQADLKQFLEEQVDKWSHAHEPIMKLNLSGAQYGAASNLAMVIYRNGPIVTFTDKRIASRLIMVSKNFPQG